MTRVLLAGHITQDVYPEGLRVGGSVTYGAAAYRALGAHVSLHTAHALRPSPLAEDGVREVCERSGSTSTFENVYDEGQRVRQTLHALAAPIRPPMTSRRYDVVHLAPVIGELRWAAWRHWLAVERAHYRPPLVALGLQGWLRQPPDTTPGPVRSDTRFDPLELPRVDLIFCSDEDLAALPMRAGAVLAGLRVRASLVVVTRGAAGCTIYERDCTRGFLATRADVVDPTGAGDTFAAAFTHALSLGASIPSCAEHAARVAARCVEVRGVPTPEALRGSVAPPATEDLPTRAEAV